MDHFREPIKNNLNCYICSICISYKAISFIKQNILSIANLSIMFSLKTFLFLVHMNHRMKIKENDIKTDIHKTEQKMVFN